MQKVKKALSLSIMLAVLSLNIPTSFASALAWPADATGTDIIDGPDGISGIHGEYIGFEPSGISWSKALNAYLVVDDGGHLAAIEEDGTLISYWDISGYDLEGTALAGDYSSTLYLATEAYTGAVEFDLDTGSLVTGSSWIFSPTITPSGGYGLEGLEWIPDGVHAYGTTTMGGVFYAASQVDGDVFVFEPTSTTTVDFLEEIHTTTDYTDASALEYDEDSNILFVAFDLLNVLQELTPTGTFLAEYSFPDHDSDGDLTDAQEEGISVRSDCSEGTAIIAIADDNGHIMVYNNFPITCPVIDDDDDGVVFADDCNDDDSGISKTVTYYQDADGDGYGNAAIPTTLCSLTSPSGYVDNADDMYDTAKIEISGDGKDNDGDSSVDEANTLAENGVHPLYGTMDPKTSYPIGKFIMIGSSIFIKYTDQSLYRYGTGLGTSLLGGTCSASQILSTAYFLTNCGKNYTVLNGLNGARIESKTTPILAVAIKWAQEVVSKL